MSRPLPRSSEPATARPGQRESFARIAERAREVLRERGLTESQIEAELNLPKREPPGD